MTSTQLKEHLLDNPTLIVSILESVGCHGVKQIQGKRVTAALPDGDNASSVQVLLNSDNLNTLVHTRSEYKGGDIFSFISFMKDCGFRNSFMYICRVTNVDCTLEYEEKVKNDKYNFLDMFSKEKCMTVEKDDNEALNENVLDGFIRFPHYKFLEDNLSIESQRKFNICYDIHDRRILIPIRNMDGKLVSIKGRTVVENYKDEGVEKYIAYYPFMARHILYGYYENYWNILSKKEVILAESEKAVIQGDGYEADNILALSKKKISDEQLFKIISLNADIVLALDKNVTIEELEEIANEFKGLCKVYAVIDLHNKLEEKESPFDRGKEVWDELYRNKVRII